MIATTQRKMFTYDIMDESGKEFTVSFEHEHQIHTWLSMESKLHNKKYAIIGIETINK